MVIRDSFRWDFFDIGVRFKGMGFYWWNSVYRGRELRMVWWGYRNGERGFRGFLWLLIVVICICREISSV